MLSTLCWVGLMSAARFKFKLSVLCMLWQARHVRCEHGGPSRPSMTSRAYRAMPGLLIQKCITLCALRGLEWICLTSITSRAVRCNF